MSQNHNHNLKNIYKNINTRREMSIYKKTSIPNNFIDLCLAHALKIEYVYIIHRYS